MATVTHSTPADSTFSPDGKAAWDAEHTIVGVGTIAAQDADNVTITGGSVTGITDLAVADGGTGLSSGTSGGVPYYSSTTTIASSSALGSTHVVLGGGAGAAPNASSSLLFNGTNLVITGGIQFAGADPTASFITNTSDGSDNKRILFSAGGGLGSTRGAAFQGSGNEGSGFGATLPAGSWLFQTGLVAASQIRFDTVNASGSSQNTAMVMGARGSVAVGTSTIASSKFQIGAGSATANTAPLQFTSGTVETTPRAGVMEYDGRLQFTDTDAARRHVVQAVASTKTVAAAPYTNDGYVELVINGTTVKVMTTA